MDNTTLTQIFEGKTAVAGDFGESGVRLSSNAVTEDINSYQVGKCHNVA